MRLAFIRIRTDTCHVSLTIRDMVIGRNPRRTFWRAAALVAVAAVVFGWVLLPLRGEGISMLPTFGSGQIGFVNTLAYHVGSPRRGDIVAIRMAGPRVMYVKRIIALPGERVRIADSVVYINDRPLEESYAAKGPLWNLREASMGPRDYFVVGDNRRMRIENHDLGIAARERIAGKVLF